MKRFFHSQGIICLSLVLSFLMLFISFTIPGYAQRANETKIENMETFTRLYGYVKYFYPGDEAAGLDWDRFAVYGAKQVDAVTDRTQLKGVLENLFHPVAPGLVIHDASVPTKFSPSDITPPDTSGMKVVTWQHQGVELDTSRPNAYKSIRLNRPEKLTEKDDGGVYYSLDMSALRGKEIKLKGAVKVKSGKGYLGIYTSQPKSKEAARQEVEITSTDTPEWTYFEVTGKIGDKVTYAFVGCNIKGEGHMWADDFSLFVKEGDQWKPFPITNNDFEKDEVGTVPTDWVKDKLKYDVAVDSETAAKGKNSVHINTDFSAKGLFELKAGFGEFISKKLGSGLACVMPIALYGSKTQTFPKAPADAHKALLDALETQLPKELSGDSLHVRLGDIAISWNVFQHFYPYFDVVKTDWKAALTEGLNGAYTDKTKEDFDKTLGRLVARLKDGHGRTHHRKYFSTIQTMPLKISWVENQAIITGVYEPSLETKLKVGDVITAVDGVDAETLFRSAMPYISAATEGWKRYRAENEFLQRPVGSPAKLTVQSADGKTSEVTVQGVSPRDYYSKFKSKQGATKHRILKDGIHYVNLDKIPMKEIDELMPQLQKARAIIFDMRGYPNSNHGIIAHLLKEDDTSNKWMLVPQVIYPDYEKVTYQEHRWGMKKKEPHLTAKIIFITDGQAISYAESLMGFIEHYKLGIIVGQPTAGTNGNINPFNLPGNYWISWTGMRVEKHDGSQHHGVGILPHHPVKRTLKGIREGRDEFLEKALEIAEK